MKCPVCKTVDLLMSDRNGIEIDYCPQCRGVWLDRGELDKIIERSAGMGQAPAQQAYPAQQPAYNQAPPPPYPQQNRHGDYGHQQPQPQYHDKHYGHHKKRREGFLSDLFDFD